MNEKPPVDEMDELYRRAVALEPSRPSEVTRHAILAHAARLAAERRTSKRRRRFAVIGTLLAAMFAGLVVVPRLWTPPARRQSDLPITTAGVPAAITTAPAAAPGPTPAAAASPPADTPAVDTQALDALALASAKKAASPVAGRAAPLPQLEEIKPSSRSSAAASEAAAPQMSLRRQVVDSAALLRRAARAGDLLALNQALTQPVDLDARDDSGRTALMLAIMNGQGGAVDVLLTHGADPNAADAAGTTPLAAALARGDESIAAALRRAGARSTR